MTWSGYLLDLVVLLELGGAAVAEGLGRRRLGSRIATPRCRGVATTIESTLAAPVRIEDHSWARVAAGDRVGQRIGDRVANDAAGGDVDHGGKIQPPSHVPMSVMSPVGDVPAPARVDLGGVGSEVPPDLIRSCGGGRVEDCGLAPPLCRPAADPAARSSRAIRLRPHRTPRRRSSAWTHGAP